MDQKELEKSEGLEAPKSNTISPMFKRLMNPVVKNVTVNHWTGTIPVIEHRYENSQKTEYKSNTNKNYEKTFLEYQDEPIIHLSLKGNEKVEQAQSSIDRIRDLIAKTQKEAFLAPSVQTHETATLTLQKYSADHSFSKDAENSLAFCKTTSQVKIKNSVGVFSTSLRKMNCFEVSKREIDDAVCARRLITPNKVSSPYNFKSSKKERYAFGSALSSVKRRKKVMCHCKNSKCLKLYCECFGLQGFCHSGCKCANCKNNIKFDKERAVQIEKIIRKNPGAFSKSPPSESKPKAIRIKKSKTNKGKFCNCKRSFCQKLYCDCFSNGRSCGRGCDCFECRNCSNKLDTISQDSK